MEERPHFAYPYQPYYCEENVWKLCKARSREALDRAWAILIRAEGPSFPILAQRAAPPGEAMSWDYHVVYAEPRLVYDFDSLLRFPAPAPLYLARSFFPAEEVPRPMRPLFRPIPAAEYLDTFSSDRSHMHAPDGSWLQPPPPWPPIGAGNTLPSMLSLSKPGWISIEDLKIILH